MADKVNTQYKDRLFKFIFGNPVNREWTLSLYNAINGSAYTNADDLEFNTLEDVLYLGMKNDVSFIIGDTMNFYEHQSTLNPNMPLRFFLYVSKVYVLYIASIKDFDMYSSKLYKLPMPKCICFYNGLKEMEDRIVLKLSDAFLGDAVSDLELNVTMININYGHNSELLASCRPLEDYSLFVHMTRIYTDRIGSLDLAIDTAMDELPDDSDVKAFLFANKVEVKMMILTEYDEEKVLANRRKEGYEEGWNDGVEEGREEGQVNLLKKLIKEKIVSIGDAARSLGITEDELRALIERY